MANSTMAEKQTKTFGGLIAADIFRSRAQEGVGNHLYLKLERSIKCVGSGRRYNAIGAHDGQPYTFKDDDEVELRRHHWEWAQGFQVTEDCIECGRPREESSPA